MFCATETNLLAHMQAVNHSAAAWYLAKLQPKESANGNSETDDGTEA